MKYNLYSQDLNIAVFDIETTGLDFSRDFIISASFCSEDGTELRQYFAEDTDSEYLLITKIMDEFNNLDAVISFNGRAFDLPFVAAKAKRYGLSEDFLNIWNLDIYTYLKKYWAAGRLLPSLSQKNVEHVLGLDALRIDKSSGKDCIALYKDFRRTGEQKYKDLILLHNGDDVKQLAKISSNLSFLPFHQIAFEQGWFFKSEAVYSGFEKARFFVFPAEERENSFVINFRTDTNMPPLSVFEDYYDLDYDAFSGVGRLLIKMRELEDYLYVDLTKMPVMPEDFLRFDGFAENYLILKQGSVLNYKEINFLAKEIIRRVSL